jgi:adenine-specific DNA-methyltransferase
MSAKKSTQPKKSTSVISSRKAARNPRAPRVTPPPAALDAVQSYRHAAKRKNIPPAGLASQGKLREAPKMVYEYNPHLPPVLRFDPSGASDKLPDLLQTARTRALTADEAKLLADALRVREPWLEWAGKREKKAFEVDPVALHIHERIAAQAILKIAARENVQRSLFADPELSYREAIQFYQHDVDWANRMILGDSLQVMASLAHREGLAGKVQMIYIDPPYGIKFASNFQPEIGKRDVKDKEADLTREPEMVKAYRDTWTLGIHSYLAYLRDRLILAKELLADSGSIFVQISDENLHRVRAVMDEVFGADNLCAVIPFLKTSGSPSKLLASVCDYLLWYAKDKGNVKYRHISTEYSKEELLSFTWGESDSGATRRLSEEERESTTTLKEKRFRTDNLTSQGKSETTHFPVELDAKIFLPSQNNSWKTNQDGMRRLLAANRLIGVGNTLAFRRYADDFPVSTINNFWDDTIQSTFAVDKIYVVQTSTKVIARCMLMTTDPGDLVLDPTCGSGTTAYVAEQWGRRWITIDTSRVALALARQRLLTATFPYYKIKNANAPVISSAGKGVTSNAGEGVTSNAVRGLNSASETSRRFAARSDNGDTSPAQGFVYKTVPHITLKSIAQNTALDAIFAKHQPILDAKLAALNDALKTVTPELRQKLAAKLAAKEKREGKKSITDADRRRWLLPHPVLSSREAARNLGSDTETSRSARSDNTTVLSSREAARNLDSKTEISPRSARRNDNQGEVGWQEWQVPFDTDEDWTPELKTALTEYRAAWRAKMDEVNAAIAANAEQEELVDQPEQVKGVVRVSGPFTMEAVMPLEESLSVESPIAGAPDEMETFGETVISSREAARNLDSPIETAHSVQGDNEPSNAEAYLDKMLRLLRADGVRFPNNKVQHFTRLDAVGGEFIHAEGEWGNGDTSPRRVAVSFGPQYGPVTAYQVENALRVAFRRDVDDLVIAGFSFDAAAQATIQDDPNPRVRCHIAHIRPDVNMGGLLKETPNSQLFTVFGLPRSEVRKLQDGQYQVEMQGVDIYNPVDNTILPTSADKVAAWFVDTDYDGRTFCITQAFFPDKSAWEKLARALKGVVDEERFAAFSGTVSLPFPAGKHNRVAVKVIDPRGNEVMRVHRLDDKTRYE